MGYWHPTTDFDDNDLATEDWLPVAGYDGYYSVSTLGRVRSETRIVRGTHGTVRLKCRVLRPTVDRYAAVNLLRDGTRKTRHVHALVAETFLVKPGPEYVVNHIDSNKINNRVENLEWVTRAGNGRHYRESRRNGTTGPERKNHVPEGMLPLVGLA